MRIVESANPPSVEALIERFGARLSPFVLDSSQFNDGLGEWSFFGADPFEVITHSSDQVLASDADGLALLRSKLAPHRLDRELSAIPFVGGAVGFLSYDYGRQIE
ncbi:MAG: hypothetical protein ABF324_00745, partial [Lentimonas sp.]